MDRPSRFESTRRLLRVARFGVVASSTAAFVGLAFVARAVHTGASTPASSTAAVSASTSSASDDSQSDPPGDFGNSSIAPSSGGTPLVQSGGS